MYVCRARADKDAASPIPVPDAWCEIGWDGNWF
jgi:hypothetical protein